MALIYDNKVFRNLQEQVQKNKQDIREIKDMGIALDAYGIKVIGEVDSESELPDDFSGDYGDAYLVGTEPPYDVYVWSRGNDEEPDDHFIDVGPIAIIGPRGPKGDTGTQGLTGPQGIGWVTYPTNVYTVPNGTLAIDPLNGDLYKRIGNPISWVNIGNIKGQQGIQGQQGPQGEKGDTGEQGPQGPQGDTGASYQVIGTYAATANLPDPTLVNPGSAALVGADAPYELYIVVGATQDVQQWVDAGVFNDQAESIPTLNLNYNANSISASSGTSITLSSEQTSFLYDNINNPVLLTVTLTTNEKVFLFKKTDRGNCSSDKYLYFFGIYKQNPNALPAILIAYKYASTTDTRLYFYYTALETYENRANNFSSVNVTQWPYRYPTLQAVASYCSTYFNQIPVKSAVVEVSGLVNSNTLKMEIYSDVANRAKWLAFVNTFLNTNYNYSQMLTYLQTTLNALGAAPATNSSSIMQFMYLLMAIQLFNGRAELEITDTSTQKTYCKAVVSGFIPASSQLFIEIGNQTADVILALAMFDDPMSVTDSDTFTFTITNPGSVS